MKRTSKLTAGRIIALGFLSLILLGALLLSLPLSHNEGQSLSFLNALFVSTSAVCVTGLTPIVVADVFNGFGKTVLCVLIQIGGLGVACIGAGFALLFTRRMGMKNTSLVREGWNISTSAGLKKLLKLALAVTLICEGVGVLLSYLIFSQTMSPAAALGTAMFHAISAFNNAGFDILGADSLIGYQGNVPLTILTAILIALGGLGYMVYWDIHEKHAIRKLSLHSKVVLSTTAVLLFFGTLILWLIGDLDFLNAFFFSASTRTAGFATVPLSELSQATLFVICILMFIGASPGSTGGGVKTTTVFAVWLVLRGLVRGRKHEAFHRTLPKEVTQKALLLVFLAILIICFATFLLCIMEPETPFMDLVLEVISAAATVGLSTGITPTLGAGSKIVLILVMYIGRLGPLTIATIWTVKPTSPLSYSTEDITIG